MTSYIASGFTSHTRFTPVKRSFSYNLSYLLIHLPTAKELNNYFGFSWNKRRLFSLDDATYLNQTNASIEEKATAFMKKHAPEINYHSAYLLTSPKAFGFNFNPVSFIYFLDTSNKVIGIIAEVHNTFKEKHIYLLTEPKEDGNYLTFESKKEFHVSPFFKTEGKYCFLFSKKIDRIEIIINYVKGETKMFHANLLLQPKPIAKFSFVKIGTQFIATALATFPRILYQAALLKFRHNLKIVKNTGLKSRFSSSRKKPGLLDKIWMNIVFKILSSIKKGSLTITLPNGDKKDFKGKGSPHAKITVANYRFFKRLVFNGDIGFADSYIAGDWSTENLEFIFELFVKNSEILNNKQYLSQISRLIHRVKHNLKNNSLTNAKKNIYDHYDLGNDFFKLFLDPLRVYSSGIFLTDKDSLETSQINKIKKALELADVQENHKLLEIGSGWGALAIYAAKTIGCHVTTVTISEEQYRFVKRKINQLHLDDKIEVKLMDYRLLEGKYDRIVSIEMLEAVGHKYLPTYFNKCNNLLKPKGKAVYQCIMIPDDRYSNYLKTPDFIQTHIFPGGHLPCLKNLKETIANNGFDWLECNTITRHYVPTLRAWDIAFTEKINDIKALGFDQSFFNTWRYYFNYCAAGFNSDYIQNHQFLIQKCN